MTTDVETADEELLRRVKAELEQPVEAEVSQTPVDYYHQNKDKVGQTLLFIFQMLSFTSHQNQNPVPIMSPRSGEGGATSSSSSSSSSVGFLVNAITFKAFLILP